MKIHRQIHLLAAMTTAAFLISSCAAGKAGSGNLNNWSAGTSVTYELTRGQVQTMEIPGQGEDIRETSTTFMVTVESVGKRQFNLVITDASTTSLSTDIKPVIGLGSTVHLDERGLILEASGLEGNVYIEARGGVDLFREDLQVLFFYLPEGALGPGSEWVREYSVQAFQNNMDVIRDMTDTYRCVGETEYEGSPALRVDVVNSTKFSGKGEMSGMPMDLAISGTFEGVLYVDPLTGMILGQEINGNLLGGIFADQFDLPMTLKAWTIVKMKK